MVFFLNRGCTFPDLWTPVIVRLGPSPVEALRLMVTNSLPRDEFSDLSVLASSVLLSLPAVVRKQVYHVIHSIFFLAFHKSRATIGGLTISLPPLPGTYPSCSLNGNLRPTEASAFSQSGPLSLIFSFLRASFLKSSHFPSTTPFARGFYFLLPLLFRRGCWPYKSLGGSLLRNLKTFPL